MRGLSELLAEHAATIKSSRVSLGDIADLRGTRSIGVWLLVLALPMVLPGPVPGISVPVWHSPDDHIGATDPGLPAGMAAGNARPTGNRPSRLRDDHRPDIANHEAVRAGGASTPVLVGE